MKTSEILRKAADEIRRRGWHQGGYGANARDYENCAVCSVGAIRAAKSGDPWSSQYIGSAGNRLEGALGTWDIVSWNDNPKRTVDEVLAAFEEAAVAAEASDD